MSELKMYIMPAGRINLPDKGHMTPGSGVGEPISMPAYCYLIQHGDTLLLVDTGQSDGGPSAVPDDEICYNQIKKLGYCADDINYVIMTHLHIDHAAYMNAFPNATFIVRHEELRAAWWSEKCEKGYVFDHYKDTRAFDFIEPEDNEEYDIFGDGSIVLIDTKGHTRGHQSILLALKNTGNVAILGDAASLRENLDSHIQPGYCSDSWNAMRALDKVRHLEIQGYKLLFGHDVEQESELKFIPEYYD